MTLPGTNSIHYPDAALIRLPSNRPVVVVEVRISQVLTNLFEVADSYLRHGNIDVVIVVDIQESGRATLRTQPWELADSALATLDREQLIEKVIEYHDNNSIAIVGNLSVSVFIWSRERIHPAPHPIWTLNTANGPGTFNSHRMRNPYLSKQGELLLFGQKWAFPFTALEKEINAAVSCEKRGLNRKSDHYYIMLHSLLVNARSPSDSTLYTII